MSHFCESEYFVCHEEGTSPLIFSDKEDEDIFTVYVNYCPMCGYKAKIPIMGDHFATIEALIKLGIIAE